MYRNYVKIVFPNERSYYYLDKLTISEIHQPYRKPLALYILKSKDAQGSKAPIQRLGSNSWYFHPNRCGIAIIAFLAWVLWVRSYKRKRIV